MYKVKDLRKKGKNYLVEIIEFDKANEYLVSEDLLIEFRLIKEKEFSKEEMKKLVEAINKDQNYQKVLKYALYKQRTKKEIYRYLDKFQIEDTYYYINKLEKLKLINDDLYAETYIHESINFKKIGPIKIREDLKIKGINDELINKYLSAYNQELIIGNIKYWFDKKLKTLNNKPINKSKNLLMNYLVNKGFYYEDIKAFLAKNNDEISSKIDESKSIKKDIEFLKLKYSKKEQKQNLYQFLTTKLLAKGYQYQTIKQYLEGSLNENE